jgi:hypothetical protein
MESKNDKDRMKDTENVTVVSAAAATFSSSQRARALRTCGYLFDHICQATHEINSTFSISILLFMALIMIFCSICLFFFIYGMAEIVQHTSIGNYFYVFPIAFALGLMVTLVILISADYPIKQVSN